MKQIAQQTKMHPMGLRAGVCGLAMFLMFAPAGIAQQTTDTQAVTSFSSLLPGAMVAAPAKPAADKAQSGEEEESPTKPARPGGGGIKMHGHWVLQVKNVDGTLGERREFDNSLVVGSQGGAATGDQVLAALLTGIASAGDWIVGLVNGPTTTPNIDVSTFCFNGHDAPSPPPGISCYAIVGTLGVKQFYVPPNNLEEGLQTTVTFGPSATINLAANFTVPSALGALGQINAVQTLLSLCVPSTTGQDGSLRFKGTVPAYLSTYSPQNCLNQNFSGGLLDGAAITSTNITNAGVLAPLPVITGQIVTVMVTLSFS